MTTELVKSIEPFDDYGFQIRPIQYWLPESPEDERERLQFNIWKYEEFMANRSRFPREVNEQIMRDYKRLAFLKDGLKLV